ncbi:cation acetate symporter [Blastococcus xanthinilyticus]|uniref:Na+(H+)/acetate symporter ActP n=1 Tax=Blastococcus xanthinilyticus TaxID=1564164 RepID=A0A5S5CN78_9ACTN|nr:cation acetate symporter [Blastococcus xanthinilyticus]TYP83835.1 Na+(H+)/acetate symporter ActP [Blastococcus xanthinilyticus]
MSVAGYSVVAVTAVVVATLAVGAYGWRFSRTTSDFFVASRTVRPGLNASAIGGEYLSAASFLGVAGLVLAFGTEMLWYPVGWTAGYLVLLVLVAAPLRRSGAYTLPDFAESRLESRAVRRLSALLVVAIGWLYLMPQFQGAGLALAATTGTGPWLGGVLVATVVLVNVLFGGMRSITFVQAFQYWLKLTALLFPLLFMVGIWLGDGGVSVASTGTTPGDSWESPLAGAGGHQLYTTYSIIVATFLGTMGLPHVVVRFYTNPDGAAARRTTLLVLALLGLFYLLPPVYGGLGRLYAPDLIASGNTESVVLELPSRMIAGTLGDLLSALTTAGAFAAFLSTSSGLTVAVAGVISQDGLGRRLGGVRAFQTGAVVAVLVPLGLALLAEGVGVARAVGLAFAFAASTFCPLLVLGIWWRRLTDAGAMAGMLVGGGCAGGAVLATLLGAAPAGWPGALLAQPAAWTVPLAFLTMVSVSLATPWRVPRQAARTMVRLHTPEAVQLDRGILPR